jgi:hypothetical protein
MHPRLFTCDESTRATSVAAAAIFIDCLLLHGVKQPSNGFFAAQLVTDKPIAGTFRLEVKHLHPTRRARESGRFASVQNHRFSPEQRRCNVKSRHPTDARVTRTDDVVKREPPPPPSFGQTTSIEVFAAILRVRTTADQYAIRRAAASKSHVAGELPLGQCGKTPTRSRVRSNCYNRDCRR